MMAARKKAVKRRPKPTEKDPAKFLQHYLDTGDFNEAAKVAGLEETEAIRALDEATQNPQFIEQQTRRRNQLLPELELATLQSVRLLIERIKATPKPTVRELCLARLTGKKLPPDPTAPLFANLSRLLQALSHSQRFSLTRGEQDVPTEVHINIQPSDRARGLLDSGEAA